MATIDSTGYHRLRLADYVTLLTAKFKAIWGDGADTDPDSPDGQDIGVTAEMFADMDSTAEAIFNGRSPDGASGAQLARIVRLNGLTKNDPHFSVGTVTLSGTPGTVVVAGSLVKNSVDVTAVFATVADATISGGGTVDVGVQATVTGPIAGLSGDLTVIGTVIPGWTGVTNAADVVLGDNGETDPQLRARRTLSVALPSQGIVDGLYAALVQSATADHLGGGGCTQAVVLENPLDTTVTLADSSTLPPHSISVITLGGLDADIAQTIWIKKSMGCTTVGSHSATINDSQNFPHTINWTQATKVPIYVKIHTPSPLSGTLQSAIQDAIIAWGAGLLQTDGTIVQPGQQATGTLIPGPQIGGLMPAGAGTQGYVLWSQIFVPINALLTQFPTLSVTSVDIGTAPSPTLQNNLPLNHDEIADFSNIGNITFASP